MKRQHREKGKGHLQMFEMDFPDEQLEKEIKDKEQNEERRRQLAMILVMKYIANHEQWEHW